MLYYFQVMFSNSANLQNGNDEFDYTFSDNKRNNTGRNIRISKKWQRQ
jgi:hypothetical protein